MGMGYPEVTERKVLVTGCSSGIGRATARTLRERGWFVVPSARKTENLQQLEEDGFQPVKMELADSDSVSAAFGKTLDLCEGKLGAIVNNAGYGQPGALEDISREALQHQFAVNLFGMQQLTNLCIPGFREQGCGRIINISSMLGRITMPFMGAYCASKCAMEALSDSLRVELHGSGIAVSIIEPGPIESDFGANSRKKLNEIDSPESPFGPHYEAQGERIEFRREKMPFKLPATAVSAKVAKALESSRPASRYKVTFPAYMAAVIRRLAPDWLVDRVFIKLWEKRAKDETHIAT